MLCIENLCYESEKDSVICILIRFLCIFPGCRSSSFNLEGRSLTSWSTSRHCVVARVQDITIDQFMEIRSKAGALLLVLPKNYTLLTTEEKEVS